MIGERIMELATKPAPLTSAERRELVGIKAEGPEWTPVVDLALLEHGAARAEAYAAQQLKGNEP